MVHAQCPRDGGCGVFALQMLTGKPYDQIASMIDWGVQTNHYTTWKELRSVALGTAPGGAEVGQYAPPPVTLPVIDVGNPFVG